MCHSHLYTHFCIHSSLKQRASLTPLLQLWWFNSVLSSDDSGFLIAAFSHLAGLHLRERCSMIWERHRGRSTAPDQVITVSVQRSWAVWNSGVALESHCPGKEGCGSHFGGFLFAVCSVSLQMQQPLTHAPTLSWRVVPRYCPVCASFVEKGGSRAPEPPEAVFCVCRSPSSSAGAWAGCRVLAPSVSVQTSGSAQTSRLTVSSEV